MKKLLLGIFILVATSTWGQEICILNGQPFEPKRVGDLSALKSLAVLQDGRIKPFETFSQDFLLRISGRRSYEDEKAYEWMARFLLAAHSIREDNVFLINHPDIPTALGIEPVKSRKYSYVQLQEKFERLREIAQKAQAIKQEKRDLVEQEILRVYRNITDFSRLSTSFSFAFPHPDFTISEISNRRELKLNPNISQFSFLQIARNADTLHQLTKPLESKPQSQWTAVERELIQLVAKMFQWSLIHRDVPFQIIPEYKEGSERWFSVWEIMPEALSQKQGRKELNFLEDIMTAYWNGEQLDFNLAVKAFNSSVTERVKTVYPVLSKRVNYEILYNKLNLFSICKALFIIVLFGFLLHLIWPNRYLYYAAGVFLFLALFLFGSGLVFRMLILNRPPVSTLYETFLFVGFNCALLGLIIERYIKNWAGFLVSAIGGLIFLIIAGKFAAEGDTLQVLVAVLNSNFWLSTHVTTITIGYAATCVAGLIGHFYLIQSCLKPKEKESLKRTYRCMIGSLGFALIMTFLGTNLGGIWADQSWGRFWGWDPKENGALLIILWLAILFHAKIGRMIGPIGLAAGSAAGIIVVMWAWFGVNLLNVGLHSYGFTSGLAQNLLIYLIIQLIFLFTITPIALKKSKGR